MIKSFLIIKVLKKLSVRTAICLTNQANSPSIVNEVHHSKQQDFWSDVRRKTYAVNVVEALFSRKAST